MALNFSLCVLFLSVIYFSNCQEFIVETTIGRVRGYPAPDGDYISYLGIPYGKVREENPFGASIPHPPLDGIFDAIDDSAICPQKEEFNSNIVGTLDCLHLNIHVPTSARPNNLRPVFVWIYGGGFSIGFFGRFLYGAKFLTRHDIVFITLNYRIGPYGFMSLDTPEIPGNQGLKDQVLALRWIRDNIAAFGGDPDKITIAGNSAGGSSVDYQIMRESNEPPLFHQAILQSGTTLVFGPGSANRQAPLAMAANLGFTTNDLDEAIAFLAKQNPLEIIAVTQNIGLSFSVVIEKEFEGVEPFITQNWFTMSEIPNAKDMPIMIGYNDDEAVHMNRQDPMAITNYMTRTFDASHPDFGNLAEIVQSFYLDGKNDVQGLADFTSDIMFIYTTLRSVNRFVDVEAIIYIYEFSYVGDRNFVKNKNGFTTGGASHADEVGYLFDISYMDEPNAEDQVVVDSMTTMWANFVKYGDPTPQTSALLPYKWQPVTKNSPYHYMRINLELSVGTRPLQERMTFWDLLFDGYGHLERASMSSELFR